MTTEKQTLTADERRDIKQIATLSRILDAEDRRALINVGNAMMLIKRLGQDTDGLKRAANN